MPEPQAHFSWSPPEGTLGQLLALAERRVRLAGRGRDQLERDAARTRVPPPFVAAIEGRKAVGIIAEVKRRSPSRGSINPRIDAVRRANDYVEGGAVAISVLTEPDSFGGTLDDLAQVSAAIKPPTLRKDFIVDEVQLLEARIAGASAALLIARALPPRRLVELVKAARDCGVEPLVEVRDEVELERALATDARLIGVNHRDLESLVIDVNLGERLLPSIPPDRITIAESGVSSRRDVERLAAVGADAVLVGSVLSAASDPRNAVRALTGVARTPRG